MPLSHFKDLSELTFKTLVFLDNDFLFYYIFFDFLLFFVSFLVFAYAFLVLFFLRWLFSLLFFHFLVDLVRNFFRKWNKFLFRRVAMLPWRKDISTIKEFSICIIRIFIFAFLLKIRKIRIVVNCFVEIMNFFIRYYFWGTSKQLVIVIEAKLSFSVVDFEWIWILSLL